MSFIENIKAKAKSNLQTIVLPESYDERMLFAAEKVTQQGLSKIIILGNPDKVKAEAAAKNVSLAGVDVLDPTTAPKLNAYSRGTRRRASWRFTSATTPRTSTSSRRPSSASRT